MNISKIALIGLTVASIALAPVASFAREIGSGGTGATGGGTTTTCTYVQSLTAKGDYRAGETGLSTVDVSYSVKQCDKAVTLRVMTQVLKWSTGEVLYENPDAVLSGKYTYAARGLYGLYTARITVFDAATGEELEVKSQTVSVVPKGV